MGNTSIRKRKANKTNRGKDPQELANMRVQAVKLVLKGGLKIEEVVKLM